MEKIIRFIFGDKQMIDVDVCEFGREDMGRTIDHLAITHDGVEGCVVRTGPATVGIVEDDRTVEWTPKGKRVLTFAESHGFEPAE